VTDNDSNILDLRQRLLAAEHQQAKSKLAEMVELGEILAHYDPTVPFTLCARTGDARITWTGEHWEARAAVIDARGEKRYVAQMIQPTRPVDDSPEGA
jgi:hypothetical protein